MVLEFNRGLKNGQAFAGIAPAHSLLPFAGSAGLPFGFPPCHHIPKHFPDTPSAPGTIGPGAAHVLARWIRETEKYSVRMFIHWATEADIYRDTQVTNCWKRLFEGHWSLEEPQPAIHLILFVNLSAHVTPLQASAVATHKCGSREPGWADDAKVSIR